MKPKIFIAQPIAPAALSALEPLVEIELNADASRILTKAELIEGVKKADILLSLLPDVVDADVLRANPNLKMVASMAIVPSSLDLATATSLKIPVTGIPAITTAATADLAWGLMLAVARKLIPGDRGLRAGMFPGGQSMYFLGGAVTGKTLGVVGLGRIGEAVARRATGFEMEVLYVKRTRLSPEREAALGVEYAPLDDLLRRSDFVVIAAASTPETRHMIGAAELAMMKPGAILVNIARGVLVDEKALVEALQKGAIGGAGLDVFEREPQVEPGLLDRDDVVLLPH
ncbi:MAG: D-glycerate dehydrogenase, partial [bacterium]